MVSATGRLYREGVVVDVEVADARPRAGERVVAEAREIDQGEPGAAQPVRQLGRANEFRPVMRAGGQPAEHVFRADDGEEIGLRRAVDGRQKNGPAGPRQPADRADKEAE